MLQSLCKMIYTRIYSDSNGNSHFEEVVVPLHDKGVVGFLSANFVVSELQFRENKMDYSWDFHTALARQFIVLHVYPKNIFAPKHRVEAKKIEY